MDRERVIQLLEQVREKQMAFWTPLRELEHELDMALDSRTNFAEVDADELMEEARNE